jgi:hypothetical protein
MSADAEDEDDVPIAVAVVLTEPLLLVLLCAFSVLETNDESGMV